MKPKWQKRDGKMSRINQQINSMKLKTILGIIVGLYLLWAIIQAFINLWNL
jgi:flagellar biosynthesis protein FliR